LADSNYLSDLWKITLFRREIMGSLLHFRSRAITVPSAPDALNNDRFEFPDALLNFARLDGEDEAAADRRFAQVAECYGFQSLRLALLDEALEQRN
jgi:hypothetical protein